MAAVDESPEVLSDAVRTLVRSLASRFRLESEPVSRLTVGQQAVLARLSSSPGMTSAELARAEFVRPQSMSATVSSLREAGLVRSHTCSDDGRRRVLFLTDQGAEELDRVRRTRADWLAGQLARRLTAEDRTVLAHGLRLLEQIVNDEDMPARPR